MNEMNSSFESIDEDARETGERRSMRSMSIFTVRASLASVSSRVDDRRMHESHRIHSTRMHACMHAFARANGTWTTMYTHSDPYILTRNTRVFDSYHTDHLFFTKNEKMNDRFVPRIETQYVHTPWSGPVVGHDTHTHSSLFHSIRIYCPRSTPYNKYKRARPRQAVNQSCTHAFVDATSRARLETIERRRLGRTNERARLRLRLRLRRDATASHSRANHRCRENRKIHWPRESTREDSFIHSFIRFGSV